jgi:nitrile hydratase subunit beta
MNGVHDLGGTDGVGAVVYEVDEPVWHAEWEKAAFSMFFAGFLNGYFNLDQFRSGIEQMPAAEYLSSHYYEHWLHTVESNGVRAGAIDPDELDRLTQHYLDNPDAPLPDKANEQVQPTFEAVIKSGGSAKRESSAATVFSKGEKVRIADDHPFGHTRRARYIRGKQGVIDRVHDAYIYPDSAGNGLGEDPQRVYTVRFSCADLWGPETGDANGSVYFDVWEPYLSAA